MPKYKFSAFLSLLVVFLSGAVVGILAFRLYVVNTVVSGNGSPAAVTKRMDPEEVRRHIIADLKTKVHLDDQQVTELNKLMDETNEAWHKMRDRMNTEGRAFHDRQWQRFHEVLRPDQQPLYDQWRTDRDNEMRKRREQQPHSGPGGPPRG